MATARRRRWFQFRLTTWFVLVGILAWAMAAWPTVDFTDNASSHDSCLLIELSAGQNHWCGIWAETLEYHSYVGESWKVPSEIRLVWANGDGLWLQIRAVRSLMAALLALLAFLAWKVAWLVVEWRRARLRGSTPAARFFHTPPPASIMVGMYTHARQFAHLAGKSDEDIRVLVRHALTGRPNLSRVLRVRNRIVYGGMLASAILARQLTSLDLGIILLAIGCAATAFVICWNLVWVNTVLYRITQPESLPASTPPK